MVAAVTGKCHVLVATDVGFEIDLDRAEGRLGSLHIETFRHKRASAGDPQGQRWPLRTRLPLDAASLEGQAADALEVAFFAFGAVCLTYSLSFAGSLEDLVATSVRLYDSAVLREDAARRVARLLQQLGDAVREPNASGPREPYVVLDFDEPSTQAGIEALLEHERETLARVLRAEPSALSAEEVGIALSGQTAYRPEERVVVDGFAALLFGRDMADERRVLELALVERVELRFLDGRLARRIDEAYGLLARRGPLLGLSPRSREVERLARFQADSAVLHESSDNALKLLGDDYLARLYELCSARFAFPAWDRAIERKLATLESVYSKITDVAARRRAELLEWIIILLFVVDIALYVLGSR